MTGFSATFMLRQNSSPCSTVGGLSYPRERVVDETFPRFSEIAKKLFGDWFRAPEAQPEGIGRPSSQACGSAPRTGAYKIADSLQSCIDRYVCFVLASRHQLPRWIRKVCPLSLSEFTETDSDCCS